MRSFLKNNWFGIGVLIALVSVLAIIGTGEEQIELNAKLIDKQYHRGETNAIR
jgi:hypothetical protein